MSNWISQNCTVRSLAYIPFESGGSTSIFSWDRHTYFSYCVYLTVAICRTFSSGTLVLYSKVGEKEIDEEANQKKQASKAASDRVALERRKIEEENAKQAAKKAAAASTPSVPAAGKGSGKKRPPEPSKTTSKRSKKAVTPSQDPHSFKDARIAKKFGSDLAGMELEAQPAQTLQRRTISSKRSGSDAGVDDQAGDPDGSGPRKRSRKSAQDDMELETVVVVPRKQRPRRKTVSSKRSGSNTGISDQAGDTHGSGPRRRSLKSDEAAENVRHIGTTEKVVSEVWQSDDNDNNDLDYALEARNTTKFAKKQKTDSQSSKMKSLGKKPVEEDDQSLSVDEIDAEVLQDFERKTPHWTKERKRRRREMEANDQQPVIQKTDALESIRTDASEEGVVFKKVPPSEGGEVDGAEADDIMRSSPPQLTMESHTEIDTSSSAAIQPSALKTQPESTELGTSPSLAAQLSPSRVEQQNLTTQTSSSSLSWEWSWRIVPQSHGFTPMLWKGSLVAGYRKMDTTTEVTRRRLQEEQFKKKYPHHLLPYSMWESLQERGLITSKDTKESLGQLRARRESLIEQYSIAFTKLTNFTTERMHANRVDNMRMRLDEYEACLLDVNYAITRLTGEQPKEEFTKPVYDPETTHSEETEPEVTIGPVVGIQEVRTEHESEPEWYKHIVELENHSEEEKTEREPTKPAPLEMEMFLRRFMAFRQHLARMRESVERQCTSAKTKLWKMRIRRNNLCHDVLQHFDKASKVKMFQKTRVTFADSNDIDEIGVDEGGLTEEMYTEFFKQFPSYGLFEDAEGAATLLPRPDAPQKELFALGRLLCKCILDDHPIGYKIGYVVFHVLIGSYDQYGVDEALDALRTWDPDLASSYCKLLKTTDSSEGLTLNNFDANLNETEVTKENIGEAVRSGSRRRLVYDRKVSWKALKGGFLFEYADLELQLGVFSRKELVHMLHGKHEYLTSQDIVESIIWPDAATESHLYGRAKVLVYLRELLESEIDFDSDCRMSFLQWCTGLVAIPCNGLRQKISLRVYQGATNGSLPVVQTCTREILLPPYSSKEQLKQKLLLAIQHCNDGFQLE